MAVVSSYGLFVMTECKNCGKPRELNTRCKPCRSDYLKAWYATNSEKQIARAKTFAEDNPERVRGYKRKWAENNPDKIKEKNQRTSAAIVERARRWRKANPEKYKLQNRAHLVRYRNAKAIPPGYDHEAVTAYYALATRLTELTGEPYQVDHIVALANGGKHHQDNLQVLPARLNRQKSTKTEYWYSNPYLEAVMAGQIPPSR